MEFRGFHSVREYEKVCASVGENTCRIPFHKGDEKYFILVLSLKQHTDRDVDEWILFTADETEFVMNGIISGGKFMHAEDNEYGRGYMQNGVDVNYLGKLAAHGYYPDDPEEAEPSRIRARFQ